MTGDLHAITSAQMFSLAKGRPKKAKHTLDKEWAVILTVSNKGSFYSYEKLVDELA